MTTDEILPGVRIGNRWHWPDGKSLPVISGGADDGDPPPKADPPAPKDTPKSFGQEEVDRIVTERLNRERAKFADYEDLKAKAAKVDELENATRSETEKAIAKAAKDADTAARNEERGKADARIIKAEVKAAAGSKLHDPMDAVRHLDLSTFKVDADGEVDAAAITAAIDDLIKTKPYLAATSKGNGKMPDLGQGGRESVKLTGRDAGLAEAQRRFGGQK